MTIEPTTIDFGDVAVGTISPPQAVALGNDGSSNLDVSPQAPFYPFQFAGGTCPGTESFALAPGESCTIEYAFAPDSGGPIEISLDVLADGAFAGAITLAGNAYYSADVAVTISDNREYAQVGDTIDYVITVYMADGSSGAPVTVTDALPANLGNGMWTCEESDATVCNSNVTSGSGNVLVNHVLLSGGHSITYTYSATVLTAVEEISNTVSVAVDPPLTVDPALDNNSATDITIIPLFRDTFDGI